MEHAFAFSLALCVGLNMADCVISLRMAELPGIYEVNPIARLALKSPPLFVAFKGLTSFVIYEGLSKLWKRNRVVSWIAVIVLDAALSFAVYSNVRLMRSIT